MLDIGKKGMVDIGDFVKVDADNEKWLEVVDLVLEPESAISASEYPIIVDDWGMRIAYSAKEILDIRLPSEHLG